MLGTALLVVPVSGLCSCLAKPSLCASQKPCTAKQRSSVGLSMDGGGLAPAVYGTARVLRGAHARAASGNAPPTSRCAHGMPGKAGAGRSDGDLRNREMRSGG